MDKDTHPRSGVVSAILSACALLTRVPAPAHRFQGASSAWAWPLVGAIVGLVSGGLGWLFFALGAPAELAAGVTLVVQTVITGAMHEDGLADTADAFWGGRDRATRLEIMKDSRIGTYGALALVFSVGLRWVALVALFELGEALAAVVVAAAISRAAMVWPMFVLPPARPGGLSGQVGRPTKSVAVASLVVAIVITVLVTPAHPGILLIAVAVSTLALCSLFSKQIGGQTGDTLGAIQQVTDVIVLAVLAIRT